MGCSDGPNRFPEGRKLLISRDVWRWICCPHDGSRHCWLPGRSRRLPAGHYVVLVFIGPGTAIWFADAKHRDHVPKSRTQQSSDGAGYKRSRHAPSRIRIGCGSRGRSQAKADQSADGGMVSIVSPCGWIWGIMASPTTRSPIGTGVALRKLSRILCRALGSFDVGHLAAFARVGSELTAGRGDGGNAFAGRRVVALSERGARQDSPKQNQCCKSVHDKPPRCRALRPPRPLLSLSQAS